MPARNPTFILSFDFDGTLVHPESDPVFHPMLGQMIQHLRNQGAAWVINTGRSLPQTLQGLSQYGIFMEPDYIIAMECDIHKPGLFSKWTDFGPWNKQARKAHTRFVKDHQASLNSIREMVENQTQAQFLTGEYGELGIVATTDEEMEVICSFIDTHVRQFPDIGYNRNGIYLRFAHSGYSKGTALSELARLLGLNASHCFAAGDNLNDLSMLHPRHACMIATPGNGLPEVKAHVQSHGGFIATRYASEGMMEALTHYFGGKS
ncbi:HAD superfamily hydrolase (TIGR01484 family) [Prosthecobacter fusiformis]|uniref:HAD superfamily hydrolase (TIGR01484 family) n=1 Tax=Prosthecobacter fusiformis TaxID=48464 RepID=A0A4R7RMJ9_9BACT|nr:HAD family hydrolase [Prosthecobacter fusiformis]TDU66018.1 HAD superfamily hydrolase (TIGR01484 family) [Prosthecobacter fusiformis]